MRNKKSSPEKNKTKISSYRDKKISNDIFSPETKDLKILSPNNIVCGQIHPNSTKMNEKPSFLTNCNLKFFSTLFNNYANKQKIIQNELYKSIKNLEKEKNNENNTNNNSSFFKSNSKTFIENRFESKHKSSISTTDDNLIDKNNHNSDKIHNPSKTTINFNNLIGSSKNPITIDNINVEFPNYVKSKCSVNHLNYIRAYSVNTNQGVVRNYNEDRVSLIINITKPIHLKEDNWPSCSFFGIFDGHGGSGCADFLRDHLCNYIINEVSFIKNPEEAIKKGCENAESDFIMNHSLNKNSDQLIDKSGSCAIFAFIIEDDVFIGNIGDSRALLSIGNGKKVVSLSIDHKPNEENETRRILANGGKIYQCETYGKSINIPCLNEKYLDQILLGPHRVSPGRLSVSRTFGDAKAKLEKFGGIQGVIIAIPDVFKIKIKKDHDFIILGCDGLFDQMSNIEIVDCVYTTLNRKIKSVNLHSQCGIAMDLIIKTSLIRKAFDNVTCIMIAFQNFDNYFNSLEKISNHTVSTSSRKVYQSFVKLKRDDKKTQLTQNSNITKISAKKNNSSANGKVLSSNKLKNSNAEFKGRKIETIFNLSDTKTIENSCSIQEKYLTK